jgi:hypothetical protein
MLEFQKFDQFGSFNDLLDGGRMMFSNEHQEIEKEVLSHPYSS